MKFKVSVEGRGKRGREMGGGRARKGSGGFAGGGLGFGAADGIVRHAALDDTMMMAQSIVVQQKYALRPCHFRDGGRKL